MKCIDTFSEILSLSSRVRRDPLRLLPLWEEYMASYGKELTEKLKADAASYDFEREVSPVMLSALTDGFDRVARAHESLLSCFGGVQKRYEQYFGASENLEVWFYLGLCGGAGWATTLRGSDAVLLGAEKIAELGWDGPSDMAALLCHELCHIAHFRFRRGMAERIDFESGDSAWQLYEEGFAQRYEQLLCGRDGFYHQDKNGWLAWCRDNHGRLCADYLRRMETGVSTGDFFGDWVRVFGHADTGYYLGCEFMKTLQQSLSTREIACLPMGEIQGRVGVYLRAQAYGGAAI